MQTQLVLMARVRWTFLWSPLVSQAEVQTQLDLLARVRRTFLWSPLVKLTNSTSPAGLGSRDLPVESTCPRYKLNWTCWVRSTGPSCGVHLSANLRCNLNWTCWL